MLIISLIVLQVLPASFCYDVELKGSLKVPNNLFGSGALRQPSELVSRLLSYLPSKIVGKGQLPRADTIASPYLTMSDNANKEEETQFPTNTPLESKVEALTSLLVNKYSKKTFSQSEDKNQKTDSLQELDSSSKLEKFMNYLKKTGKETIYRVAFYIKEELNIKKNITHIITIISNDYTNKLQNYYDYVKIKINDSDRDSLYLDMIETTQRLLFNEENKLLNDIVMHEDQSHDAHNGRYKQIKKEIARFSYLNKRQAMRYMYVTYNNSYYPVDSGYGADLINEIIMLKDKQFLTVLQSLAKILKDNDNIIARITEKEDRDLMKAKLRDCIEKCVETTYLSATKENFAKIWSVITQRFQPGTSGSEEFKVKIKATWILMDFVDKALSEEEEVDWVTFDYENTIRAIRNWRDHKRDDIGGILEEFANSLLKSLDNNLTRNERNKMKVLITVIMRGNTEDFQHMLKMHSDNFHSDIDIVN